MSQIIRVDGAKLLVHAHNDAHQVVEAYELALFLGYAQQHLLRKQVLTDWKPHFKVGRDYLLVRNERAIRAYEREYASRMPGEDLRPMQPYRGRLFLLPDGLRQVLLRSSKKRAEKLLRSLERKHLVPREPFEVPKPPKPVPAPGPKSGKSASKRASVSSELPDVTRTILEARRENYVVVQKLLEQLRELEQPHLQLLAVEAAEIMLGRSLTDLRDRLAASTSSHISSARARSRGPLFGDEGYYSLTQIGRKAGYSAKTAGLAANIVGARLGLEPDELRTQEIGFNRLQTWTDDLGTDHELFRFDREFSNEVLEELRSNHQFKPLKLKPVPPFSGGTEPRLDVDVSSLLEDETATPA